MSAINLDKIICRRDKVFTKNFIFHNTVYIFVQVLFKGLTTESMSTISGLSSCFIIIPANHQSFCNFINKLQVNTKEKLIKKDMKDFVDWLIVGINYTLVLLQNFSNICFHLGFLTRLLPQYGIDCEY